MSTQTQTDIELENYHQNSSASGYNQANLADISYEGDWKSDINRQQDLNELNARGAYKDSKDIELTKEFVVENEYDRENIFYNEDSFPDGGIKAYSVVFGSFIGLIPVFGMMNSIGAIQAYISQNQLAHVESSTVSWIFSVYLAISYISCIFTGEYFDRNGGFKPMCFGTILFTGGIMAMANSYKVYHFILSFSICCGLGSGILMTPLISCVSTWFLKKRGVTTSIATIGGSVGGIVLPLMLRNLYEEIGFEWAIRTLGVICLCCLIISIIFARERKDPNYVKKGFKNKKDLIIWYCTSCFNVRYFLDLKFLFATLGVSFAENSMNSSATFIASYATVRGFSKKVGYTLITATNAAGIFGRFIPGFLADKYFGAYNVVIVTVMFAALWNFVLWLPFGGNINCLWAYVCLYGFSSGSIMSLIPVCIGAISKTSEFGKRYSTTYLVQALITIPIIPISGAIIGDGKSIDRYNNFIVFTSILMLAGVTCFVVARYFCVGFRLCKF